MSYATLCSRIQMLEYLVQLPCVILEIKKIQAEVFRENVDTILRGTSSLPMEELTKKTEAITLTIGDFIQTDEYVSVAPDILEIMQCLICFIGKTPKMVEEKPETLDKTEANLILYLQIMDAGNINRNTVVYVDQNPYRESARKLLRACRKLKEATTFFYEVAVELRVLCQDLRFLMTFVDKSSGRSNDHELMKSIVDVVNGAGDVVENFMVDNKIDIEVTYFIRMISKIPVDNSVEKSSLETVVKDMFDGENGIRETLWETLKKIHYIKGQIENIFDKTPDLKSFQSRSISLTVSSKSHNLMQEDIVIGLDDDIKRITERLTRSPPFGREILTVMGMGGIGKTTLARKVFDHPFVVYHFHRRAWITVSQIYQVKELFFRLLCSVSLPTYKIYDKSDEDIAEDLYRSLKGFRYLIVMDNVWSAEPWDAIQRYFPDENNGSRILLTTRSAHVASQNNHFMRLLENNQSWELLERVVFGREICPPELMEVGRNIARECQGLPLAIVVIGGLLSRIMRTHDCWKDIETNVSSFVCADPEDCLNILALSYNHLPHYLRACFLYLGAFPKDCNIEVHKLITMWIAEGFLNLKSSKDLEQVAEDYLEDLVGRNLVLVGRRSFDGKIKTCHLHDILRELCLREAQKENFMQVIKRGDRSFVINPRSQHRLSFHVDPYDDDVQAATSIPQLLSFMYFALGSGITSYILFVQLGFKLLRVLDIYFLLFDCFPSDILNLIHLRYLALYVTYEFPASISKLRNLQTFLIHGPWPCKDSEERSTLLFEYWSMPSLRHLHSSIPSCLKKPLAVTEDDPLPLAPRHLQTLSTLTFASCRKEIFSLMPNLKKIGICETHEDYMTDGSSKCLDNLVYLHELETLKCSFYREIKEARTLCWDALPSNLRHLTLSGSYLSWGDMVHITKLPHLEVLKLKYYAFQGPNWELTEEVFCSLKVLVIDKSDLVHWETTSTVHFPRLEHLVLRSCESLNVIPSDIGELSTLLKIELEQCSAFAVNSAREFQEQNEDLLVVTGRVRFPTPA